MKKIFTLLFALFLAASVYAQKCPYCGQQFNQANYSNHTSICLYDSSDSEGSESSFSDNTVPKNNFKRDFIGSGDDEQSSNKRKKIDHVSKIDLEFIHAAATWDEDTVENLLENEGVNIDAIGNDGSALRCAISELETDVGGGDGPQAINVIQYLLDNNASVMDAVLNGNVISILIDTISIHEFNASYYTEDFKRLLNLLISKIEDFNTINDEGITVLAILVQSSVDLNILESAIEKGAKINALDKDGISILTHAINNCGASTATAAFLIAHGAVIREQEVNACIKVAKDSYADEELTQEWKEFSIKLLSPQIINTMLVLAPVETLSPEIVFPTEVKYNILHFLIALTINSAEADED